MNKVKLEKNLVSKTFSDKNKLNREVMGTVLFGFLSNGSAPQLVSWGSDFCITSQLKEASTCFESVNRFLCFKKINSLVAEFIANNFAGYQKGFQIPSFMRWGTHLASTIEKFKQNKTVVSGLIGTKKYEKILNVLLEVQNDKSLKNSMTLIHGDLHLDNILISNNANADKIFVIDFEHSIEAPVEMEFQNSLFWNDEKSLSVNEITEILKTKYKIPYSEQKEKLLTKVYVAHQINLALGENDLEKLQIIAEKLNC